MAIYEMFRGDDFVLEIQVSKSGRAVDISGGKLWFTAKYEYANPDSLAVSQLSSPGGGIVLTFPLQGKAVATMPSSATTSFADGLVNLVYDVQYKDAAGKITTVDSGTIMVTPDVTRTTTAVSPPPPIPPSLSPNGVYTVSTEAQLKTIDDTAIGFGFALEADNQTYWVLDKTSSAPVVAGEVQITGSGAGRWRNVTLSASGGASVTYQEGGTAGPGVYLSLRAAYAAAKASVRAGLCEIVIDPRYGAPNGGSGAFNFDFVSCPLRGLYPFFSGATPPPVLTLGTGVTVSGPVNDGWNTVTDLQVVSTSTAPISTFNGTFPNLVFDNAYPQSLGAPMFRGINGADPQVFARGFSFLGDGGSVDVPAPIFDLDATSEVDMYLYDSAFVGMNCVQGVSGSVFFYVRYSPAAYVHATQLGVVPVGEDLTASQNTVLQFVDASAVQTNGAAYLSAPGVASRTDADAFASSQFAGVNRPTGSSPARSLIASGLVKAVPFTTAGGAPTNGAPVYLAWGTLEAGAAGKLTATKPTGAGQFVCEVGICLDNARWAGSKTCDVLVAPKGAVPAVPRGAIQKKSATITRAMLTDAVPADPQSLPVDTAFATDSVVVGVRYRLTELFAGGGATSMQLELGTTAAPLSLMPSALLGLSAISLPVTGPIPGTLPDNDALSTATMAMTIPAGESVMATFQSDIALSTLTTGSITIDVYYFEAF